MVGFCVPARVTMGFVWHGSTIVSVITVLLPATVTSPGDLAVRVMVWAPTIPLVTLALVRVRVMDPAVVTAVTAAVTAASTAIAYVIVQVFGFAKVQSATLKTAVAPAVYKDQLMA